MYRAPLPHPRLAANHSHSSSTHNLWNSRKKRKDDRRCFALFIIKICTNRAFLSNCQPFLLHSFFLVSLMSEPLKIWFCQFACRSFSYWAPLLPKCRFTQERRAIERFQRSNCNNGWKIYKNVWFLHNVAAWDLIKTDAKQLGFRTEKLSFWPKS